MGRCLENGVIVLGKDFEPVADVVGMVCPDLRGDAEVGTEESGAKLCGQRVQQESRRRAPRYALVRLPQTH
jgi:hypothetical protein